MPGARQVWLEIEIEITHTSAVVLAQGLGWGASHRCGPARGPPLGLHLHAARWIALDTTHIRTRQTEAHGAHMAHSVPGGSRRRRRRRRRTRSHRQSLPAMSQLARGALGVLGTLHAARACLQTAPGRLRLRLVADRRRAAVCRRARALRRAASLVAPLVNTVSILHPPSLPLPLPPVRIRPHQPYPPFILDPRQPPVPVPTPSPLTPHPPFPYSSLPRTVHTPHTPFLHLRPFHSLFSSRYQEQRDALGELRDCGIQLTRSV